jgi:hypothetical protein
LSGAIAGTYLLADVIPSAIVVNPTLVKPFIILRTFSA